MWSSLLTGRLLPFLMGAQQPLRFRAQGIIYRNRGHMPAHLIMLALALMDDGGQQVKLRSIFNCQPSVDLIQGGQWIVLLHELYGALVVAPGLIAFRRSGCQKGTALRAAIGFR
jgi:hypothetical protein